MENYSEKINEPNVRSVIGALAFLQTEATEDELLECFLTSSEEPRNLVHEEVKRILDYGVTNGFIVKTEDKYTLPHHGDSEYEADGDDGDDSDVEYIDPNYPHYEVLSSPSAREAGMDYRPAGKTPTRRGRSPSHARSPPKNSKRKYTKRLPEPTTRQTRSVSRARMEVGDASPTRGAISRRGASHSRGASSRRRAASPMSVASATGPSKSKRAKKEPKPQPTRFSSRTAPRGRKGRGRGRGR